MSIDGDVGAQAGLQHESRPPVWLSCKRTGTRCTTFTQLPVAFSGGSSENCEPVLGTHAGDRAENFLPG